MNNADTTVFISDADQYVFGQGTHYDIYKKLGAHFCKKGKKEILEKMSLSRYNVYSHIFISLHLLFCLLTDFCVFCIHIVCFVNLKIFMTFQKDLKLL